MLGLAIGSAAAPAAGVIRDGYLITAESESNETSNFFFHAHRHVRDLPTHLPSHLPRHKPLPILSES